MTKKSQSRLDRDAAAKKYEEDKKNNKAWDELKNIHSQILGVIINISTELTNMFSIPEINKFLSNSAESSNLIRCISDDSKQISKRLAELFITHKDKSGGWNTDQEFFDTIAIFEQYNSINSEINGLIIPNFEILSRHYAEAVARAEKIVAEEKASRELTDPNVVSDVTPKESAQENV